MMKTLDTNIVLRYIWEDVPGQREKVERLLNDKETMFCIPDYVIPEVIYNLQQSYIRRSSIVGVLYELAERKNIQISSFVLDTVLPFFAEHPALSFVDCYTAFEAEKKNRTPLLTFDRKLANQHPSVEMV